MDAALSHNEQKSNRQFKKSRKLKKKNKIPGTSETDRILAELVNKVEQLEEKNSELELNLEIATKKFKKSKGLNLKLRKKLKEGEESTQLVVKLKSKLRVHKKYIKELTEENDALKERLAELGEDRLEEIDF